MKLLQHSWSDMLVLDHIHQHMHNNLANEIMLHNGQKFDLLALGLLGVTSMADCFAQVIDRLQELKFDVGDYICLKFLLLLNPGKSLLLYRRRTLLPLIHHSYTHGLLEGFKDLNETSNNDSQFIEFRSNPSDHVLCTVVPCELYLRNDGF